MTTFKDILGTIPGGRVLDIATGSGRFVEILKENLASYDEIIGIDHSERAEENFKKSFSDTFVQFMSMDAAILDFPDTSFDTVCISFSLHHMPDPLIVLNEMKRVLRPSGHFIVREMYRDNQAETQLTHVLLHDWWGTVDTAQGICHNPTYTRQEIYSMLQSLGLSKTNSYDLIDLSDDPHEEETLESLENTIDQYIRERITGLPVEAQLKEHGESLRQRFRKTGSHNASVLVMVMRKP